MLSRALSSATVTLLIGCLTAVGARAQENLEAGKSPSQIFAGTCSACHKSPRGLLKTVPASSLPGYLRQHYTTSSDMASLLASFLISNGAADPRYQAKDQPKQKDAKQDGRPDQPDRFGRRQQPPAPATEASRPESEGTKPQGKAKAGAPAAMPSGWQGRRDARRQSTCGWPDPGAGRDRQQIGRQAEARQARQASRRRAAEARGGGQGRSCEGRDLDAARTDAAKTDAAKIDAAKTDAAKSDVPTDAAKDAAKTEGDKPEAAKPSGDVGKPASEAKSETAKVDAPKESGGSEPVPLRPDPVPPVTPAPPPSSSTGRHA